jgi:hypothetical protein
MYTPHKIFFSSFQSFLLKTISGLVILYFAHTQQAFGQLNDDFSDGDFSASPVWLGQTSNYIIESNQLKLKAPAVESTSFLSTTSSSINNASWEFYVKMDFATSATSLSRIYLVSDQQNLSGPLNGYYVEIGNSTDEVSLYKQTGTARKEIIDGLDGRVNQSVVQLKVKVTRDSDGNWELFSDPSAGYVQEGVAFDNTHFKSSYFGVFCLYIASRSEKYFFDDFIVTGDPYVDTVPPGLLNVSAISDRKLLLEFSEEINSSSGTTPANFLVQGLGHPSTAETTGNNVVELIYLDRFTNGEESTLEVSGVKDVAGNEMTLSAKNFLFFEPSPIHYRDIIITEIFPDPNPKIGLPEAEFVEVYNRSNNPIDLNHWKLTDGSSAGVLQSKIILPNNYAILTTAAIASEFNTFGKTVIVANFPTLNNGGDLVLIKDNNDNIIDSVRYAVGWFKDDDKQQGGWTLELKDPENTCLVDDNWKASVAPTGGTPGRQNSVYENIIDTEGPTLLEAQAVKANIVRLTFNEKLSNELPSIANVVFNPACIVDSIKFSNSSLKELDMYLKDSIEDKKTYHVTIKDISDCAGNFSTELLSAYLNLDTIPPSIESLDVLSTTEIQIVFSEKLIKENAETIEHFHLKNLNENPIKATLSDDGKLVTLTFEKGFGNGIEENLIVTNLYDINNNVLLKLEQAFLFFEALPTKSKDIIITEIFSDPTPSVGLPEAEFIEIYNRSGNPVNLKGWRLTDGSSVAIFPSKILLPAEYIIVSSASTTATFASLGKAVGVLNFPTLNNSGDAIVLTNNENLKVDSVNYSSRWFRDDDKREGGWTLELIDVENICAEEMNWTASDDESGGTPGRRNSEFANKPDVTPPHIVSVIPVSADMIQIVFSEKLSSVTPSARSFYMNELNVLETQFADGSLRKVSLLLSSHLEKGKLYNLTATEICDCAGNRIANDKSYSFGLPEAVSSGNIVVNELLFNPRPTGVDFIEFYNNSSKYINLKNFTVGNIENDEAVDLKSITTSDHLIAPLAYFVLTTDIGVLKGEYLQSVEDNFIEVDALPSLSDDEGSVSLVDSLGNIIDQFLYTDKMHSIFIKESEGVSLERIHFDYPTDDTENWKSASSTVGFATPGYVNSNFVTANAINESVQVNPEVFLPLSGQHDFTQINYQFNHGGYVANVKIFDPQGVEIKRIASNEILPTEGFFRWDGDRENGTKASVGSYMVWFEIFDDQGQLKTFKKRVAIAGRF